MSTIDVNSVLAQIRALSTQTRPELRAPERTVEPEPSEGFGGLLKQGIDAVAERQSEAGNLQKAFELGDPNVDLATVMLASSKAGVAFRGMVEVRNRLVNAYQEIMNMPV